jgi:hypothetical protein
LVHDQRFGTTCLFHLQGLRKKDAAHEMLEWWVGSCVIPKLEERIARSSGRKT